MKPGLPRPRDLSEAVLWTHLECCDGAGCAVLFIEAGGRRENVRFIPAGGVEKYLKRDPHGDLASGRFVVMADLGITSSRLSSDLEKRGELVLLDHHRTSLHLTERSWCWVEMGACGAKLLLEYLRSFSALSEFEHALKAASEGHTLSDPAWTEFSDIIDDHDRWLNKRTPTSHELVNLMTFVGQEDFVRRMANFPRRLHSGMAFAPFTDAERFCLDVLGRQAKRRIEGLLPRFVLVDQPWGRTAYVVSSETNISELLHEALERYPDAVAVVQLNIDKGIASLRSRPGFDCSEVAKQFGGGGHAQASGHSLPPNLAQMIVEEVH